MSFTTNIKIEKVGYNIDRMYLDCIDCKERISIKRKLSDFDFFGEGKKIGNNLFEKKFSTIMVRLKCLSCSKINKFIMLEDFKIIESKNCELLKD